MQEATAPLLHNPFLFDGREMAKQLALQFPDEASNGTGLHLIRRWNARSEDGQQTMGWGSNSYRPRRIGLTDSGLVIDSGTTHRP
jgi:hypothetical protein